MEARPKILVLGEAWGQEEEFLRRPFVGPSGQELMRMLAEAGIDPSICHLTNVLNLRPPSNDLLALCCGKRELPADYTLPPIQRGKYLRPEYLPELERLRQEIIAVAPTLILALGNTALWAISGQTGIGARRGTVEPSNFGPKFLATYHPASVLRNWNQRPIVMADLTKAAHESTFGEIRTDAAEIWIEPTIEDLYTFRDQHILNASANANPQLLSFDIETIPSRKILTCIGFAPSPRIALVVPFADRRSPNGSYWSLEDEPRAWSFVREVLNSPLPKLGQNGLYDLQWLWGVMHIPVRNYAQDTMLHHHALFPEMQKDLGFLGSVYTNFPSWKQFRAGKGAKKDD